MGSSPTRGSSLFLGKVTALGVLCCFALFVCLTLLDSFFLPSHLSLKTCRGIESHPRHLIVSRKSDCLGCAVLHCLVCLFDLACFFLSSFSSLIKNMSWDRVPSEAARFFLGKVTALGVLCCFALFASFFLPSVATSFKSHEICRISTSFVLLHFAFILLL